MQDTTSLERSVARAMPTNMATLAAQIRLSPIAILLAAFVGVVMLYLYTRGGASLGGMANEKIRVGQLLSAAIDLAERGGKLVAEVRMAENKGIDQIIKGETQEGAKEYVTKGDMTSHRAIVKGLLKAFPTVTYVSEEHEKETSIDVRAPNLDRKEIMEISGHDEIELSRVAVWIDPLDATQEYTEKLLQYVTVMVCIAVDGRPVAGVIHHPHFNDQFPGKTTWAWVGHGASPGLMESATSTKSKEGKATMDHLSLIVSRSHSGPVNASAQKAFGPATTIVLAGGAGYKVLQVVSGTVDGYVHVTCIKKWDICSGDAILRALGGKMTTLDGAEIDYSTNISPKNEHGLLASLGNHQKMRNKLTESGTKVEPCKH